MSEILTVAHSQLTAAFLSLHFDKTRTTGSTGKVIGVLMLVLAYCQYFDTGCSDDDNHTSHIP